MLDMFYFVLLNIVFLYILLGRTSTHETFIANSSPIKPMRKATIKKLYVRFPDHHARYEHHGGIPIEYHDLIYEVCNRLFAIKDTYSELDEIELYVPRTYPHQSFLRTITTLLPFVSVNSDPDAQVYHNVYELIQKDATANDMRRMRTYAHQLLARRKLPPTKRNLIVLIKPAKADKSASIKNIDLLEDSLTRFADAHGLVFQSVVMEDVDIFEQINLFKGAVCVIGQHGAGLANVIWTEHCKLVVEFSSNNKTNYYKNRHFHQFADQWLVQQHNTDHITISVSYLKYILEIGLLQSNP